MFKVFYEDLEIGKEETFGAYEVTKEEVIEFASKYDPQPFHMDEEMAKHSVFGGLCASGWHTCAMTMRILVDYMAGQGFAGMGSPGVDGIKWKQPVFPGDTLSVRGELIEKRESQSRSNLGLVKSKYSVFNQKEELVMQLVTNVMVLKRGDGE
jgi:acyl dehydratase